MSPGRRSTGPELVVVYWRTIPAQVTARAGRTAVKRELSPRFQVAIDRAAMAAGLDESDEYLSQWRSETRPCAEDLDSAVAAEVDRLESTFTQDALNSVASNGGRAV